MTTSLKIFRVFNVVEIFFVLVVIAMLLYHGKFSFSGKDDIVFGLIFLLSSLVILGNCTYNFLLLKTLRSNKNISTGSEVFFWSIGMFFLLICILLIWGIIQLFISLNNLDNSIVKFDTRKKVTMAWFLCIALNGMYIFFMQIVLFFKIRKINKSQNSLLISEIGEMR